MPNLDNSIDKKEVDILKAILKRILCAGLIFGITFIPVCNTLDQVIYTAYADEKTDTTEEEQGPQKSSNFKVRFQNGQSYSNESYGHNTIGNSACGPSSLCNALSAGGIAEVDVPTMCAQAVNWGARASTGTDMNKLLSKAKSTYGFSYTVSSSPDELFNHLLNGGVAILLSHSQPFTSGGHYIAAIGITDNGQQAVIADSYWYSSKKAKFENAGFVVVSDGIVLGKKQQISNKADHTYWLINSKGNVSERAQFSASRVAMTVADAFDWSEGSENRESAWDVYTMTDWKSLGDRIQFGQDGSMAKANVSDEFREKYQNMVEDILNEMNESNQFPNSYHHDKTQYREIILAMAYVLSDNGSAEEPDVCNFKKYIRGGSAISDPQASFYRLCREYLSTESQYLSSFRGGETPDVYDTHSGMTAVIQGTVFHYTDNGVTQNYVTSNASYSADTAKEFSKKYLEAFKNNPENPNWPEVLTEPGFLEGLLNGITGDSFKGKLNTFAEDVLKVYEAVKSAGAMTVTG